MQKCHIFNYLSYFIVTCIHHFFFFFYSMACWLSCILTFSSCSFSCSLFCLHLLYISTIWHTRIPFNWSLDVKQYDIILYYNPANWLIGWTDRDLDVVCVCVCGADAAADRRLNVRMEAWTKKWTDRWRGRQAARREQPLIAVLLTMRLVNTLLRLKHYLPLSGCPELSAKTKTKKGPRNLFITYSQCVHVASPHIRSQPAYFCR